jgi:hypothetical protein
MHILYHEDEFKHVCHWQLSDLLYCIKQIIIWISKQM